MKLKSILISGPAALALLPVLTSTGRRSDIAVPMAAPSFGRMTIELLAMFVVPTPYCVFRETQLRMQKRKFILFHELLERSLEFSSIWNRYNRLTALGQ